MQIYANLANLFFYLIEKLYYEYLYLIIQSS